MKIIDITGRNDYTFFLFEFKYNIHRCSELWDDVTESLRAHLDRNKKENKPLNILAAGYTFAADTYKNPVLAYKVKLLAPNGVVLKRYISPRSRRKRGDLDSDEFFIESTK